jgi:prevent-host-death family protein
MTRLTSRELNQDVSRAKREAMAGPVFITDRGKPSHVLLSIDAYRKLTARDRTLGDSLSMPGAAEIDFDPQRSREMQRAVDLDA